MRHSIAIAETTRVAIAVFVLAIGTLANAGDVVQNRAGIESAYRLIESATGTRPKPARDGTRVTVPAPLRELLERGGTPTSLDELRLLEAQQRIVADRAARCTVSVRIKNSQGCGVIITDQGFIVTAAHVAMRPGLPAIITLSNGRQVRGRTLGMNREVDAGLIKIEEGQNGGQPWPHASLGTSENLQPGMWCIAMGHPGGYESNRAPVIRVGRLLRVRPEVLVSDCALIGGDSGGPLFDIQGDLIAVHSRIGNDVADNLHVPINHYNTSWDRMAASNSWGHLPGFKPTLGVSGNQRDAVARILKVAPNSPAEAAGIQVGDIIEEFGEKRITNFQSLKEAVSHTMPGEPVKVWVRRETTRLLFKIEIGRSNS